ncbi:LPS assembly lipoprotein LptE [Francisella sp. SYW-9]|uniref:LPS-assembly lipoprotein LptE n=1 Tax=Francisella sp. SYW-9 TaxID=2610888 RepID=UPI00123D6625|nr:LPS assembly lipoprotein LptE [Francisella sp. SYW-9]
MKKYIIIIFVLLLCSCGFHRRGIEGSSGGGNYSSLVGTKFYIAANNYNSWATDLKSSLQTYKAIIVTDEKQADYIINIQSVKKDSKLTSVVGGASNNTYQLFYNFTYNVVKPNDKTPVIPNKTISAQQFWQSNSGTQLAQNAQAERIYNYLQSGMVTNIIDQIAALLPSKTLNTSPQFDES